MLDRPGLAPPEGFDWLPTDLKDLRSAAATVTAACAFDFLVNNVALIIHKPHEDFSLEEYEEQIRVNTSAAFVLTKTFAAAMKGRGWGRIINLTSLTLNGQWNGYVPYVASKGALLGLTKRLARELGPHGITVSAIAPGAVVSEAERRVFADRLEAYEAWVLEHQVLKCRYHAQGCGGLGRVPRLGPGTHDHRTEYCRRRRVVG